MVEGGWWGGYKLTFFLSLLLCLLPCGLSLSAPAKATAAAPASPGPNPTGLLVVIGLVLLMTTTGLLSVLREANSQHVLYGRDEVAVREGAFVRLLCKLLRNLSHDTAVRCLLL